MNVSTCVSLHCNVWFPLAQKLMTLRTRTILINHMSILVTKTHEVINPNNERIFSLINKSILKTRLNKLKYIFNIFNNLNL